MPTLHVIITPGGDFLGGGRGRVHLPGGLLVNNMLVGGSNLGCAMQALSSGGGWIGRKDSSSSGGVGYL